MGRLLELGLIKTVLDLLAGGVRCAHLPVVLLPPLALLRRRLLPPRFLLHLRFRLNRCFGI